MSGVNFQNVRYIVNDVSGDITSYIEATSTETQTVLQTIQGISEKCLNVSSLRNLQQLLSKRLEPIIILASACDEEMNTNSELLPQRPAIQRVLKTLQQIKEQAQEWETIKTALTGATNDAEKIKQIVPILQKIPLSTLAHYLIIQENNPYVQAVAWLVANSKKLQMKELLFLQKLDETRIQIFNDPQKVNKILSEAIRVQPEIIEKLFKNKDECVQRILQSVNGDIGRLPAQVQMAIHAAGKTIGTLKFNGCSITPQSIANLARVFPNLVKLSLRNCIQQNSAFITIGSWSQLKKLTIVNNGLPTSGHLKSLLALKQLKKLRLVGVHDIDDQLVQGILQLPELRKAYFDDCPKITDAALQLSSGSSKLEHLDISSSNSITDVGLSRLSSYTALKSIVLPVIRRQITSKSFQVLAKLPHFEKCTFFLLNRHGGRWKCEYAFQNGRFTSVEFDSIQGLDAAGLDIILKLAKEAHLFSKERFAGEASFFRKTFIEKMKEDQFIVDAVLKSVGGRFDALPRDLSEVLLEVIKSTQRLVLRDSFLTDELVGSLKTIISSCPEIKKVSLINTYGNSEHRERIDHLIEYFSDIIRKNPTDFAYAMLGELLHNQDPEKAKEQLRQAVSINPKNAWALGRLGRLLLTEETQKEALFLLERSVQIDPADPLVLNGLGSALKMAGRLDEAIDYFKKAFEMGLYAPEVSPLIEALKMRGRFGEAWSYIDRMLRVDPDRPFLINMKVETELACFENIVNGAGDDREKYHVMLPILKSYTSDALVTHILQNPQSIQAKALKFLEESRTDQDVEITLFLDDINARLSSAVKEMKYDFSRRCYSIQPSSGEIIFRVIEKSASVQNVNETIQDLHRKCKGHESHEQLLHLSFSAIQEFENLAIDCRVEVARHENELASKRPQLEEILSILKKIKFEVSAREGRLKSILASRESEIKKSQDLFQILQKVSFAELKRFVAQKQKNIYMNALDLLSKNSSKLDMGIQMFLARLQVVETVDLDDSMLIQDIMDRYQYQDPKLLETLFEDQGLLVSRTLRAVKGDLHALPQLLQSAIRAKRETIISLDLSGMKVTYEQIKEFILLFSKLQKLDLKGSTFPDKAIEEIIKSTALTTLDISGNAKLSAQSLQSLSSLVRLRELNISGCETVDDEVVQKLLQLPELTKLWLADFDTVSKSPYKITSTTLEKVVAHQKLELCAFNHPSLADNWEWICSLSLKGGEVVRVESNVLSTLSNKELADLLQFAGSIPSFRANLLKMMQNEYYLPAIRLHLSDYKFKNLPQPLAAALLEILRVRKVLVLDMLPLNESLIESIGTLMKMCPDLRGISMEGSFGEEYDREATAKFVGYLHAIIGRNPESDFAYAMLGEIGRQTKDFTNTEDNLRKAIRYNPRNSFALGRLGSFLATSKPALSATTQGDALSYLGQSIEIDPRDIHVLTMLGAISDTIGLVDEAISYFNEALEICGDDSTVLHKLGQALKKQGRFDEAWHCYKRALETDPENEFIKKLVEEVRVEYLKSVLESVSLIMREKYSDSMREKHMREKHSKIFSIVKEIEPQILALDVVNKPKGIYKQGLSILVKHLAKSDVDAAIFLNNVTKEMTQVRFSLPYSLFAGLETSKNYEELNGVRREILRFAGDPDVINKAVERNKEINPRLISNLFHGKTEIISTVLQRYRGVLKAVPEPLLSAIRAHGRITDTLRLQGISLTPEILGNLAQVFPNVRELPLSKMGLSNAVAHIIGLFTQLQKLDLSGNSALSEAGFQGLYRLRNLLELNLDGCHHVNDAVVRALLDHGVDLSMAASAGAQSSVPLSGLPRLQRLSMAGCPLITNEAISPCRSASSSLLHLDISDSVRITDAGLKNIASYSTLESIALPNIDQQITSEGLRYLAQMPALKQCSFSLLLPDGKKWKCSYRLNSGKVQVVTIDEVLSLSNAQLDALLRLSKGTSYLRDKLIEKMKKELWLIDTILSRANFKIDTLPAHLLEAVFDILSGNQELVLDGHPYTEDLFLSVKVILEKVSDLQGISLARCSAEGDGGKVRAAMMAFFEKEREAKPQSDFSRAVLGELCRQAGHADAEKYFKEAIAINSRNDFAAFRLGLLFSNKDRFDEAIPYLERVIELSPSSDALFWLAQAWHKKSCFQKAESYYKQHKGISPQPAQRAKLQLINVLRDQRKATEVLPLLREYCKEHPSPEAWVMLGEMLAEIGSYGEARSHLLRVLDANKEDTFCLVTLGELERKDHQHMAAKTYLERAKVLYKANRGRNELDCIYVQINLCELFIAAEDNGSGLKEAEEALKEAAIAMSQCKNLQSRLRMKAMQWDIRLQQAWSALNKKGASLQGISVHLKTTE